MKRKCATADLEAGRIAERAHGVVTHRELRAVDLSEGQIRQRLLTGALLRQHPGVYRVGHRAPSIIDPLDRATLNRIPVTTVARTLVDIAPLLSLDDLARACHEAQIRHQTKPPEVEAVLKRRPNSRGAAKLRSVLRGDIHVTLSTLERRFLQLLSERDLPLPVTNRPAGTKRVDCRWPDRRLTVELDSFRYHNTRHSWEQDRTREREAHARGDQFRRYTYADVLENPDPMLRELEALSKR